MLPNCARLAAAEPRLLSTWSVERATPMPRSPHSRSLRRGGRLVLMGSMTTPLPLSYGEIMRNNWEIIGQFMYPAGAYRSLLGLVRAELLDLKPIRVLQFPLAALPAAMDAAANATNLECVVVEP